VFRYALTLIAYAVALVAVGYVTYSLAPEGANAKTALVISAGIGLVCVACAVLGLLIKGNRTLGMIGVHVGLIMPLLAVGGTASRLGGAIEATNAGNAALATLSEQAKDAQSLMVQRPAEGELKLVFPDASEQVDMNAVLEPRGYQAVGIASTAALSAFAFLALLFHRPKLPPKPKKDTA
jgi:hypothetical protein